MMVCQKMSLLLDFMRTASGCSLVARTAQPEYGT